jgi:hypothetical protein
MMEDRNTGCNEHAFVETTKLADGRDKPHKQAGSIEGSPRCESAGAEATVKGIQITARSMLEVTIRGQVDSVQV